MKELKLLNPKIYEELPLDVWMKLNFNENHLYTICIHQNKSPLNFAFRGVQQVYVNKYISMKKRCNMTCYIHTTSKRECDGQEFKVET